MVGIGFGVLGFGSLVSRMESLGRGGFFARLGSGLGQLCCSG